MVATPFEQLQHLIVVPVLLEGVERSFVLDSGIGLTIVRDTIGGCDLQHQVFTGKRMSGQQVSVPLATVETFAFAGLEQRDVTVGLLDMTGFPAALDRIDGFLSLAFFADQPFTVCYRDKVVEDGTGARGVDVPLRLERDGPSLTAFMSLTVPGGTRVEAEVDMGSDALILDERFAHTTGLRLDADGVRRVTGIDETGNAYVRWFTQLRGAIHPAATPELTQRDPEVVFQRIIHDGLVGHAFLRSFDVTWDLPRSRLLLAPLRGSS